MNEDIFSVKIIKKTNDYYTLPLTPDGMVNSNQTTVLFPI